MKILKTKFETDTVGFYITPIIGISRIKGVWELWFGWLFWLWTITLNQVVPPSNEETSK